MRPIDADKLSEDLREAGMVFALRMVAVAPAIDVAPVVHERWIGEEINIETGDISTTLQECSVCHRIRTVDLYCAHCGAKMDKET